MKTKKESNEELYHKIDKDDEMSDKEKRETYNSEIAAQNDYEDWCDEQCNF